MVVNPPTPGVLRAADVLEQCIREFLQTSAPVIGPLWEYEAPVESANLITLAVRYIEGIILLARDDLVTLPAAAVLARSTLEACTRATWLVLPSEIFEREARWLAHLRTECDASERTAREFAKAGIDSSWPRKLAAILSEFADDVAAALPDEFSVPKQIPNFKATLESIGRADRYVRYIELSQFAHATHAATNIYRKNIGSQKELGEFITPAHWKLMFEVAWDSLESAAVAFFAAIAPTIRPFGVNLPGKMRASIYMIDVIE